MKTGALRLQSLANVAGAALLYWLAAPLLSIGGAHPFDSAASRAVGLVVLLLLALAAWGVRQWLRKHRNTKMLTQLQGNDASEALAGRFSTAMNLLRAGIEVERGGRSGNSIWPWPWPWRRRRQVYELPWYVFIGAPGAGKTTALLHSGLRFPLAERLGAAPVAGIGGTRQCDWWFTDRAVFIDTAGRYTTQDSHHASDAHEWKTFLQLREQLCIAPPPKQAQRCGRGQQQQRDGQQQGKPRSPAIERVAAIDHPQGRCQPEQRRGPQRIGQPLQPRQLRAPAWRRCRWCAGCGAGCGARCGCRRGAGPAAGPGRGRVAAHGNSTMSTRRRDSAGAGAEAADASTGLSLSAAPSTVSRSAGSVRPRPLAVSRAHS